MPRTRIRKVLAPALFFALILSLPVFAQQKGPRAVPVVAANAVKKEVAREITLVGTVFPYRVSEVAAQRAGLVELFLAVEGSFFEKGSLLARLDRETTEIERNAARARLGEAIALMEKAKKDLDRTESLYKKETVPEKSYTDDLYAYKSQNFRVKALEEEIARLDDLLEKTEILSPFAGYIAKEFTEVGQWVNTGSPICRLVEIGKVKIRVDTPGRYVVKLKQGARAQVTVDALPGKTFYGIVDSISPEGDQAARTFPVILVMDNPNDALLPGKLVRVALPTTEKKAGVFVPKDALVAQGGAYFLYMINEGKAVPVPVERGRTLGNLVEVKGPVPPGARVVVRGNERLRPGQPVVIIEKKKK